MCVVVGGVEGKNGKGKKSVARARYIVDGPYFFW